MGLLDQLFGLSGGNSSDWVRQMQAQMTGGPMVGPMSGSGGQSAMLGAKPPQAGERKMFPAPDAPKAAEAAPAMASAAPATSAKPSFTPDQPGVLSSALRGFAGEGGGFGILGAIGNATRNSDEAERQKATFDALVAGGVEPRTAELMLKQPQAFKVTEALKEKKASEAKSTELVTQRLKALMTVDGMTPERALAIAQDEAAFRDQMKPENRGGDFGQPAGLLAKGFMYDGATGTMKPVPGGPADQKIIAKQQADKSAVDYTFTGMDRLAMSVNDLLKNEKGLSRITGMLSPLPNMPGGSAANAQAQLETLKAQVAFQTLQDMRNASKTGGALGQVTERELAMLQNALVPLEQAQSLDQFKAALQNILKFTEESKARVAQAYQRVYGDGASNPSEQIDGSALQGRGNQPLLGAGSSGRSRIIGVE